MNNEKRRNLGLVAVALSLILAGAGVSQAKKSKKDCKKDCTVAHEADKKACDKKSGKAKTACEKDAEAKLKKCKEACSK